MKSETEIRAIHTNVIEGTVRFDAIRNKQICEIRTVGIDGSFDGNTRTLATSDLHQTFWTVETKAALDKIKAKAKRAARRSAPKAAPVDLEDIEVVVLEDADSALTEADPLAKLRALVGA